jgi:hypothetical protein
MTFLAVQNQLGWHDEGVLDLRRIPQDSCRPRHWSFEVYSVCFAPTRATYSIDRALAGQTIDRADRRPVTPWSQVLRAPSENLPL